MASRIGVVEPASDGVEAEDRSTTSRSWKERSGRLYQEFRSPSMRMVRRAFGRAFGDDEVEDIYGNAWLGTLRSLEHRQAALSDEEIRKYVFTAVANHASKELRRRGRRPTAPLEAVGEIPDLAPAPEDRAASADERQLARDLLASLPVRRRAVMLLRYGCGLEPRQICALVGGLTPRSYRKEITRGVDELTEKLRLVERGDWCAERESLMKAFAAGLATEEQSRAARHHLARCRECSELVGRLTGHLHDLSGALTMPAALEGVAHGDSIHDRVIALGDRVREAMSGPLAITDGAPLTASGAARGGGAAGAGMLAKLAGVGGGKLVMACLAGGAVATTCAATGVLPSLAVPELDTGTKEVAAAQKPRPAMTRAETPPTRDRPTGGAAFAASAQAEPPASPTPRNSPEPAADRATASVAPERTTPLAPTTPPVQQQFGVPAATPPAAGSSSGGAASTGGSATQQEFGP